jgi:hypothetical protein
MEIQSQWRIERFLVDEPESSPVLAYFHAFMRNLPDGCDKSTNSVNAALAYAAAEAYRAAESKRQINRGGNREP